MSCLHNYVFKECSAYEYENVDCGNCIHTRDLEQSTLRQILSTYNQHCKFLYTKIDDLINKYI